MSLQTVIACLWKRYIVLVFTIFLSQVDGTSEYKIVCYYTNWSQFRPGEGNFTVDNINATLCTHIIFLYGKLVNNELKTELPNDEHMFKKLQRLKDSNQDLKTLISVGGWDVPNVEFSRLVEKRLNRETFIQSAILFLHTYGFDGIELDWQYPTKTDRNNFVRLAKEMNTEFAMEGYLVTASIPSKIEYIDDGFIVEQLIHYLDFFNLMSFNFYDGSERRTGHNSPLYARREDNTANRQLNMNWAVEYWINKGVPKNKLIIGMATFGQTFELEPVIFRTDMIRGPGLAGRFTKQVGLMSYYEICLEQERGGIEGWNDEQNVPYYNKNELWIGFDNVKSITKKVEWLKYRKLGGANIRSLDLDDYRQMCSSSSRPYPLLSVIYDVLTSHENTTSTTGSGKANDSSEYKRVCYYTNWSQYRLGKGRFTPDNINATLCTHIIFAYARIVNNELKTGELNDEMMFEKLQRLKVLNLSLRTLIAVGGHTTASSTFSTMAESRANRLKFIRSTMSFLRLHGFDGLSLDWEYPTKRGGKPEDKSNLLLLVKEMKGEFVTDGFLLTASVSAGKEDIDDGYDVDFTIYLDFINIIAFDKQINRKTATRQVSPLYPDHTEIKQDKQPSLNWTAEYWSTKGIPKKKLIIGMAMYGLSFTLINQTDKRVGAAASELGASGQFTSWNGFLSYYEICLMQESGGILYMDHERRVPYYINGKLWVGFESAESIHEKIHWLKDKGFGGVMIWSLDLDDFRQICDSSNRPYPLLSSMYDLLTSENITKATTEDIDIKEVLYKKGSFSYSKCEQTRNGVTCENLNITKERQETVSLWPAGPYAILMTKLRCPEWQSKGWRTGVLILQSPTSDWRSKFTFCAKIRNDTELDKEIWVPGIYRIFKVGTSCPEGFSETNRSWTNPIVNGTLSYFGNVPAFKVHNNSGNTSIMFHMCEQNSTANINAVNFGMLDTEFLLGKNETSECPQLENTFVSQISHDSHPTQSYCFYTPRQQSSAFMLGKSSCNTRNLSDFCQPNNVSTDGSSTQYKLVCFYIYSNKSQDRPGLGKFTVDNINATLCTHIIVGFVKVFNNELEPREVNDTEIFRKIERLKDSNPGLKTLIYVGGEDADSSELTIMVKNSFNRKTFIRSTISFLHTYGFDGIDFDWQYVNSRGGKPQNKWNVVLLAKEMKAEFIKEGYLVTASLPSQKVDIDNNYDVEKLALYIDFFNVRMYNFQSAHRRNIQNAPLYPYSDGAAQDDYQQNLNWVSDYLYTKGVPRDKLMIGFATFGRTYDSYGRAGRAGNYTKQKGFLSYYEICLLQQSGGIEYWDDIQKVPFHSNGIWVGFDNEKSLRIKVQWLKEKQFGGANIRYLDLDDFNQVCNSSSRPYPLLNTVYDLLLSGNITSANNKPETRTTTMNTTVPRKSTLTRSKLIGKELTSGYFVSTGYLTMSDNVMNFFIIEGILLESELYSEKKEYFWYQLDFQRTISVLDVLINFDNQEEKTWIERSKYIYCFFDNVRWSFQYLEAGTCETNVTYIPSTLIAFHIGNVHARFITLIFEGVFDFPTSERKQTIQIFVSDFPEVCTEDLGMGDWSIQDFQMTASSSAYLPSDARPSSAGWCKEPTDTEPWILVDLVAVTIVEGISIWYTNSSQRRIDFDEENISFFLYYGKDINKLSMYKDMQFDVTTERPANEEQTFTLLNPIKARYIKLEFQEGLGNDSSCLKFELHGCKLSGIPSLNCTSESEMFMSEATITTEAKAWIINESSTIEDCLSLCLLSQNCSVARYNETCIHYQPSMYGMWQIVERGSEAWSAKLCPSEPIDLFPSLKSFNGSIMSNVERVTGSAVITSIGYPFSYGIGQTYMWIVQFPEQLYIRILFTNVSLSLIREPCHDKLLVSKELEPASIGKEINHNYNGRVFVVETDESSLVLTFTSCPARKKITGKGFRMVITEEKIPACLSNTSDIIGERVGICRKAEMFLTSMSLLNHPFENTAEWWDIQAGEHHTVQIRIINFYVVCPRYEGEQRSKFVVFDASEKITYCNTNVPPEVIHSKTPDVTVFFQKFKDLTKKFIRKEGFRLRYTMRLDPLQSVKYSKESNMKVCSETFGKCYHVLNMAETWNIAEITCRQCNMEIVSLPSQLELSFVRSLLKEHRNAYYALHYGNPYFYESDAGNFAHIGFRRHADTTGKTKFMWDSGDPSTYHAWKSDNPRFGEDCTKLDISSSSNEAVESESCTSTVSQFVVCQSVLLGTESNEHDIEHEVCKCRNGWVQNARTCYFFGEDPASWHLASTYCLRLDTQLIEIENEEENIYLYSHLRRTKKKYWIDLTNAGAGEKDFYWNTSGNPLEFHDLVSYSRDSDYNFEYRINYCVELLPNTLRWGPNHCHDSRPYICKGKLAFIEDHCIDNAWRLPSTSVTYTGQVCQNWNNISVEAQIDYQTRISDLPDQMLDSHDCRDPSASGIPWCYTSGTNLWEPCFIENLWSDDIYESSLDFSCKDGSEISFSNRCNGVFDCMDFSDEMYCNLIAQPLTNNKRRSHQVISYERFDNTTHFLCSSEEWIIILAKCDDVIDCSDSSDETNCTDTGINQNNGASFCEGKFTPIFLPDEEENNATQLRDCTYEEFKCGNKLCIPVEHKCDGAPDCVDMSDENQCESCKNAFHCDFVKCIPLQGKCDLYVDCEDRSDEKACVFGEPFSCDQLWKQKGLASGIYYINGLHIFCDFSSVGTHDGNIKMSVQNMDVDINMNRGHIYTRTVTNTSLQIKKREFEDAVYIDDYSCVLEIKSACSIRYSLQGHSDAFYNCECMIDTFEITRGLFEELYNTSNESYSEWESEYNYTWFESTLCDESRSTSLFGVRSEYYNITSDGDMYIDDRILTGALPIEITPEIKCIYKNITSKENVCKWCIYDGADSDQISRCGSNHLEHCVDYPCPENTVKCPGSYCIPLNLVCNKELDCPDGQDELQCTCSDSTKEVFILTEDTDDAVNNAAIKLAAQFYTAGSDIRILYFSTQALSEFALDVEHRLLEIREKKIHPFKSGIQNSDCIYKSMARNLLAGMKFTTSDHKGIIFLENTAESSKVAQLMFSNISRPGYPIYRVFKDMEFHMTDNKSNTYSFVQDIRIKRWSTLFSLGYRRFPQICKAVSEVPCKGGYRCSSSKQCIPLEKICDGIAHCIGKDDEQLCDIVCPSNCTCVGYSISCRGGNLKIENVRAMSFSTRSADLSGNPGISKSLSNRKLLFPFMTTLNLSFCEIKHINEEGFNYLYNLRCLDIGYNKIEMLSNNTFRHLRYLTSLNLDGNFRLRLLSSTAFRGLIDIKSLKLTGTNLKQIVSNTFHGLSLQTIDISNNKLEEIEDYAFNNTSVDEIDISGNNIQQFSKNIFSGIVSLQRLNSDAFKFCCIRPCYVAESECYPQRDEFSSCKDLMRHPVLQAVLYLVGITAFLGNLFSIIYRIMYDRERLKIGYGIFVTNLAGADLLMGVYLLTIAIADSIYRDRYIYVDEQWRNSVWCTTAGVLSTVSSEASVLLVCLITLDRLLVIKYPFGTIKLTPKKAYICCFLCWISSTLLAVIPVVYTDYFKNKFYSRAGVCVALPLTKDKPPGWIYSVSIFVGLNFCTFVLVAFGQCSIMLELRKATAGMRKTEQSRKRDLQVARNLILVATTDFLCWFPIGVMGIMALTGRPISGDVYAWTAVFVLPFNSALNPILYTLSAIIKKESFSPSTEEQRRTETTKEVGRGILRYEHLLQCVRIKKGIHVKDGKSVHAMTIEGDSISTTTVTTTCILLFKCLCVLHEASVSIDSLSLDTIYININDKKNANTSISLDSTLSIADDERNMRQDIYQTGIIIRRLLAMRRLKDKTYV